ncbi:MAG: hypothetical protein WAL46_09660 [Nitrososphaeraceae archaeon]
MLTSRIEYSFIVIFCYGLVTKDKEVCDEFPKEIDKSIAGIRIIYSATPELMPLLLLK